VTEPYRDVPIFVDLGDNKGVGRDFDAEDFFMIEFESVQCLLDGLRVYFGLGVGGEIGQEALEIPNDPGFSRGPIPLHPSAINLPSVDAMPYF
jgi:hypothetical protein